VVDVVPVLVVSLVEGTGVLEENVLRSDVLSNLSPSGLPEVPETGLVGLESGDVGVKLVGEAGDRSHDEHHSADDTLPHVGSLLLLGNGLHESSSVESFLLSSGKVLPVARFLGSDGCELGTRSADLEWSKRKGNVQRFVEVQVELGVVLVSSGIVLANDENFIARDVSVGDDTAGLGARKADREKTTTSDLQHSVRQSKSPVFCAPRAHLRRPCGLGVADLRLAARDGRRARDEEPR